MFIYPFSFINPFFIFFKVNGVYAKCSLESMVRTLSSMVSFIFAPIPSC